MPTTKMHRKGDSSSGKTLDSKPSDAGSTPASPAASGLSKLTGTIRTLRPNSGQPYGIPWSNVTRWEPAFTNAARESGVHVDLLAAMAIVESDANHTRNGEVIVRWDARPQDGPSVGIMQVKPQLWQSLMPNADAYDPVGNIRLGAALMARFIEEEGSWEKALTKRYFPSNDPNGTTQNAYVKTVKSLMQEMNAQLGANPPTSDPNPPTSTPQPAMTDPLRVIVGGRNYTADYGFKSPAAGPYYEYFSGHGGNPGQHTGIDVPGTRGETLYTPASGIVTCAGTGVGQGSWGTSCAAFPDLDGGGSGRIEIMLDSGASLILGHCARALVSVGQRVLAGTAVAKMGGMNGSHVHVETRVWREDGRCS